MVLKESKIERKLVERELDFPYYASAGTKEGCRQLRAELRYYKPSEWNKFNPPVQNIKVTIVDPGTGFTAEPLIEVKRFALAAVDASSFFNFIDNSFYELSTKEDFDEAYQLAVEGTKEL